jgi:hypothetical protein
LDTPEIEGRCQEEIERAVMASDYTRALVAGRVVTLSAIQPDKYRAWHSRHGERHYG